jgi:hypothetical protein
LQPTRAKTRIGGQGDDGRLYRLAAAGHSINLKVQSRGFLTDLSFRPRRRENVFPGAARGASDWY